LELAIEDDDPDPVPTASMDASDPSPDPDPTTLLANVTKQKQTWTQPCGTDLPPSDIWKVILNDNTHKDTASSKGTQQEIVIDGTCYRSFMWCASTL
jgi:hypothetical protein